MEKSVFTNDATKYIYSNFVKVASVLNTSQQCTVNPKQLQCHTQQCNNTPLTCRPHSPQIMTDSLFGHAL